MRILFDGLLPVDYGQAYVISRELPDMHRAFAGQRNGLCGAGDPGALFLITGTHYGRVRLTIELHDRAPAAAAPEWEDVVEVRFLPRAAVVDLVPWGDGTLAELPLTPDGRELPAYRVRFCAAGMDAGRDPYGGFDPDELDEDDYTYLDQRPDRYLLCLWPEAADNGTTLEAPTTDVIVRQASGTADYSHSWAAALPAPPTLWDQVEAEISRQSAEAGRHEEYRRRDEARRWGGRPPGERLRRVSGNVHGIARLDRDLVDGVAEADDATQRRIAIWAARRAFSYAGAADLDWLAPAWAALERGEPLPADFTDPLALLARIKGAAQVTLSTATLYLPLNGPPDPLLDGPVNPAAMAIPALAAAGLPDPLQAALEALWAAATTYAARHAVFLAEVREAFPIVDRKGTP